MAEGKCIRKNVPLLVRFLVGRLFGYLIFGVLAWVAGSQFDQQSYCFNVFIGASTLTLALLLLAYGFGLGPKSCAHATTSGLLSKLGSRYPTWLPLFLGLFTGLNLCPPFLLAFTEALKTGSLLGSLFFFAMFFIGTSLFFIPFSFLGLINKRVSIQNIGKSATAIIGLYYTFTGLLTLFGQPAGALH
jgi:sulfite exporter TauE/SafE